MSLLHLQQPPVQCSNSSTEDAEAVKPGHLVPAANDQTSDIRSLRREKSSEQWLCWRREEFKDEWRLDGIRRDG